MRTVFSFILLLVVGCNSSDVRHLDFSPRVDGGRILSISTAEDLDINSGVKVTLTNHLPVGGATELWSFGNLPLDYYWGLGTEEDSSGFYGGLSYRLRNSVSMFGGLSKWEDENIDIEYGAQLLFEDFTLELRRDESLGETFVGMGMDL